jgi:putative ABC transport system permease protein
MFARMIRGGIVRQWRKLALMALAMALGTSLAVAMLNIMLDVGDKINRELKAYGANLTVVPRSAALLGDIYGADAGEAAGGKFLREDELPRLKMIFWAFNIVDFSPYLETRRRSASRGSEFPAVGAWFRKKLDLPTGESAVVGLAGLKTWWKVEGNWPEDDGNGALLGRELSRSLGLAAGDSLVFDGPDGKKRSLPVTGIFAGDGAEDGRAYLPLALVQEITGRAGLVERVEVSALTTPENDLARRAAKSPASLSAKEWDAWYCTAYISSIAYQIEEVLTDARAKPLLQVSESEGAVLGKVELLMTILTILVLACTALAMSNLVTAGVMERKTETGLLKAIGATDADVMILVAVETFLTAAAGAAAGYALGIFLSKSIGATVFGTAISVNPAVIPLAAAMTLLVASAGSLPAMRLLLSFRPAQVLHAK